MHKKFYRLTEWDVFYFVLSGGSKCDGRDSIERKWLIQSEMDFQTVIETSIDLNINPLLLFLNPCDLDKFKLNLRFQN